MIVCGCWFLFFSVSYVLVSHVMVFDFVLFVAVVALRFIRW